MENVSLWTTLGVGFVLGLKHALDTDHVVAVSTLVAREGGFWRSSIVGALWGLGHTLTLLIMGLVVIVLGWKIPDSTAQWLEMGVALMLMILGARALWEWRRGDAHLCVHSHDEGESAHDHAHFHRHGEHACAHDKELTSSTQTSGNGDNSKPVARRNRKMQSFLVGTVHGLSGSAALMLLVLSTIRHPLWGLTYIAVFGSGMMISMFAMSAVFSFALSLTARWSKSGWGALDRTLRVATGAASLSFGLYLTYQIGVVDGLFR